MLKKLFSIAACSAILASSASALNIVVVNDDSYETANVQQLKIALETAGHDVILSVPCAHQSGKGGSMGSYLKPIPIHNLSADASGVLSINDTNGTDGYCVGNTEAEKETITFKEYMDGTPLMSSAHGLFKANEKWSSNPDLVISGPNEGRNVGFAVFISGTLGAAHLAIYSGVPAIAVSAGSTPDDVTEALTYAKLVATKVVDIVEKLESTRKAGETILPLKMGLNVNLPDAGTLSSTTKYKFTNVNWAFEFNLKWANLGEGYGAYYGYTADQDLYGLNLIPEVNAVGDTDENSEGIAAETFITISTMDATENAPKAKSAYTSVRLNTLVK